MATSALDKDRACALAVSDSGFVFDPRTGHSYTFNGTGLLVLRGIQAGLSPAEIASRVRDEFDASDAPAEEDIAAFDLLLREMGLTSGRAIA